MAKTVVETYKMYDGTVDMMFYPNSHAYRITDPLALPKPRVKEKMIGVTGVTGVINKPALQEWPMKEAIKFLTGQLTFEEVQRLVGLGEPACMDAIEKLFAQSKTAYKDKQQRGRDVGSKAHDWIEMYFKAMKRGETLPALPETLTEGTENEIVESQMVRKALEGFLDWMSKNEVEVVDVERFVYSRKYGFCGKLDSIVRVNGKVYIKDAKTSNGSWEFPHGVYPEYYSQLGGYDVALTEEFPEWDKQIAGHLILNCSKNNGKFNARYSFERKLNRTFFLSTLGTKRGLQHHTRELSMQYRENRPKKGAK